MVAGGTIPNTLIVSLDTCAHVGRCLPVYTFHGLISLYECTVKIPKNLTSSHIALDFSSTLLIVRPPAKWTPTRRRWDGGGRAALLQRHDDDRSERSMGPYRYYGQFRGTKAASLLEILSHDDSRLGCLLPRWLSAFLPPAWSYLEPRSGKNDG